MRISGSGVVFHSSKITKQSNGNRSVISNFVDFSTQIHNKPQRAAESTFEISNEHSPVISCQDLTQRPQTNVKLCQINTITVSKMNAS